MKYKPAQKPTFYFIGVTTTKSSIMKVFPQWAKYLKLGDVEIKGLDFALHDNAQAYRDVVQFIKSDPLSLGALITTHKLDLFAACHDLFDQIDEHATLMAETSCLSKLDGKLICHAKDPISSGLSLDGFLPKNHFQKTGGEVFSMGAGGSTIALTWHLAQAKRGVNRPSKIIISNRSQPRLEHIRTIHQQLGHDIPMAYIWAQTPEDNDRILQNLKANSLVINATGLGKDMPGSPLSDAAKFPKNSIVWDLNYRGDLVFLEQARRHKVQQNLTIHDGWSYFIHGWTQVISEVFHINIPTSGPVFDDIAAIAERAAK